MCSRIPQCDEASGISDRQYPAAQRRPGSLAKPMVLAERDAMDWVTNQNAPYRLSIGHGAELNAPEPSQTAIWLASGAKARPDPAVREIPVPCGRGSDKAASPSLHSTSGVVVCLLRQECHRIELPDAIVQGKRPGGPIDRIAKRTDDLLSLHVEESEWQARIETGFEWFAIGAVRR